MDLITVLCDGTMRAAARYIAEKGIQVSADAVTARMREIVKAEYGELLATAKDALDGNMGGAIYRQIVNTYCTSWGIRAVNNTGRAVA